MSMRRIMASHPDYEMIKITQHYLAAAMNPGFHFDINREVESGVLEGWKLSVAVEGLLGELSELPDEPLDQDVWGGVALME